MNPEMGLYDDVSMASLPNAIAMMGNTMMMGRMGQSVKRRMEDCYSMTSSCGDGSSSTGDSYTDKKIQQRERNRLQARKSRTLKKQCTGRLQQQLQQLHQQAEKAQAKDDEAAKKIIDRRNSWRRVLRKVFDLRAEACADEEKWLEVISSDLRLTMPITPYRSFNPADVVNNRRVLLGVDGVISDTQSLRVTCDNIGVKTRRNEGSVSIYYTLASDEVHEEGSDDGERMEVDPLASELGEAFFNRDGLMCAFRMRTLDAIEHGARSECEQNGMIRARFDVDNKLEELEMTFDAIAFYHQLMLAQGKDEFPIVPNTLYHALKDEKSRIVVTTAQRPFRITHVNTAWTNLCGFELEECQGKTLSILQGPETDMKKVADLCKLSQKGYATSMVVTNHNKKGELFRNHLRCYPVSSDQPGEISHIVGVLTSIPNECEEKNGAFGGSHRSSTMMSAVQAC